MANIYARLSLERLPVSVFSVSDAVAGPNARVISRIRLQSRHFRVACTARGRSICGGAGCVVLDLIGRDLGPTVIGDTTARSLCGYGSHILDRPRTLRLPRLFSFGRDGIPVRLLRPPGLVLNPHAEVIRGARF